METTKLGNLKSIDLRKWYDLEITLYDGGGLALYVSGDNQRLRIKNSNIHYDQSMNVSCIISVKFGIDTVYGTIELKNLQSIHSKKLYDNHSFKAIVDNDKLIVWHSK